MAREELGAVEQNRGRRCEKDLGWLGELEG
jgi:hypothetical protein